jgi:hypothetical protein
VPAAYDRNLHPALDALLPIIVMFLSNIWRSFVAWRS